MNSAAAEAERPARGVRALVRRAVASPFFVRRVDPVRAILRTYGPVQGAKQAAFLLEAARRSRHALARRPALEPDKAAARQTSDTLFVFGSGASLHEISEPEWRAMERCDTLGVNYFIRQKWIALKYHYVREVSNPLRAKRRFSRRAMLDAAQSYADLIAGNPLLRDTVLFLQDDFFAEHSRAMIGWEMLPQTQPFCLYVGLRRADVMEKPPERYAEGVPRQAGAIGGAISIGATLGWRRIVLVGVDMYDARYFWLPPDAVRNPTLKSASERHPTAGRGVIETMGKWRAALADRGVSLEVYNPRSLLQGQLPQFAWADGTPVHALRGESADG